MTNVAGVLLGIQTADCVPVLVVDVGDGRSQHSTPGGAGRWRRS